MPTPPDRRDPDGGFTRPPHMPERIGGYRILGVIGEGGMGTVYAAEQENPHRQIALKVIRGGLASADVIQRFERESEVLGRLQHPGIAQVYQAGTEETPHGPLPYLAMELVRGRSLTQYVRDSALDTRARLDLFARICDAVHYAHQRGVIHRDLKPANILVEESGQPRILDFGVARLTDSDIEATRQTSVGEVVGTLQYMSPEQIGADPLDIDIRSDVYSLGVILYELIAERLPYDLRSAAIYEAMRVIAVDEPPLLGTFNRNLRGDVETIVAKALEKEKSRRYDSALELGTDVRRYLAYEPIAARPATVTYQLRKFARRNRALVGGVIAVMIVLTAGATVSTVLAIKASAAERQAQAERSAAVASQEAAENSRNDAIAAQSLAEQRQIEAEQQRAAADSARTVADASAARARREASKALAVSDFLQEMLASADPSNTRGRELTLREVLDTAAGRARVSATLHREPEVNAAVQSTIGRTYSALGDFNAARTYLDSAYAQYVRIGGPSTLDVAHTAYNQVGVFQGIGDESTAERKAEEALTLLRRLRPAGDDQIVNAMHGLAHARYRAGKPSEAEALHREALALRRAHHTTPDSAVAASLVKVATFLGYVGRLKEALPLLEEGVELTRRAYGNDHPALIVALQNYVWTLHQTGDYINATRVGRELLASATRVYGATHQHTATAQWTLGEALASQRTQQTLAEGETLMREALSVRRTLSGDQHSDVQLIRTALGRTALSLGKFGEADSLFTDALNARRATLGENSPAVASSLNDLSWVAEARGDYVLAERRLRESLPIWQAAGAKVDEARAITAIGRALQIQGKLEESEPMMREGIELLRAALGPESQEVGNAMEVLGNIAVRRGNLAQADSLHRAGLEIRRKVYGPRNPLVRVQLQNVGFIREMLGDTAGAEPYLREAFDILVDAFPGGNTDVEFSRTWLATDVCVQRRYSEAEPMLRTAVANLGNAAGALKGYAQSALGDCMRRQNRYEEAEQMLTAALTTIESDRTPHAGRRTLTMRRLVALYEAWGKPEKVAEWRAKLAPPTR